MKKVDIILSVIIVTYRSNEIIDTCLDSLYKHNDIGDRLEVLIVDNSQDDIMLTRISNKYPKVLAIKNSKNGGYGQGNNLGINKSRGKYVLVCNPDVIFIEPVMKKMINYMQLNPNVGLLGIKQIGGLSFFFNHFNIFPFYTYFQTVLNRLNLYCPKKMFLSGSFLLFLKKAFISVGKFDEKIFLFCEEVDISSRLLKSGYNIRFESKLKYYHPSFSKKFSTELFQINMDSLRYIMTKYNKNMRRYLKIKIFDLKLRMMVKAFGKKNVDRNNKIIELYRLELDRHKNNI